MARPLSPLTLTTEQQELLETISRCREVPHSLIQRVHIVLSANAGRSNKTISQDTGLCEDTVGFWRKRWLVGCADLEKLAGKPKLLREAVSRLLADKPRPGSLTSVGFFIHNLQSRKRLRMPCSYQAVWAMLPVVRV